MMRKLKSRIKMNKKENLKKKNYQIKNYRKIKSKRRNF